MRKEVGLIFNSKSYRSLIKNIKDILESVSYYVFIDIKFNVFKFIVIHKLVLINAHIEYFEFTFCLSSNDNIDP